MKIHRFHLNNIIIVDNNIVTQETGFIHQIKNVLRYKKGDIFHIFNDEIGEIEVELIDSDKKDMSLRCIRHIVRTIENKRRVHLFMSVIKNSNFDLVVEKAVEIGVTDITPVLSNRSVKTNLNMLRLNKIIKESTEQCGRIDLLKIHNIEKLENIVSIINKVENKNTINVYGSVVINESVKTDQLKNKDSINLFIGPEGGYSEGELMLFKDNKILPLNINKNILRAETAAILNAGILLFLD